MRARRDCSSEKAFRTESMQLVDSFSKRGYKLHDLERSYKKVSDIPRIQLLNPKRKTRDETGSMRIIGTYCRQSSQIYNNIKKYWHTLHDDKDLLQALPVNPQITYRKWSSLKDMLIHYEERIRRPQASLIWLPEKPKGKIHIDDDDITSFYNCSMEGVIYVVKIYMY